MDSFQNSFIRTLKKIKALNYGEFELASGAKSSFYLDLRYIPAFPPVFKDIISELSNKIVSALEYDVIIGIPSAGGPFATGLALLNMKPTQLLRRKPKEHGMKRQIEGPPIMGKRVLLVDDLISSGYSKQFAVDVINQEGGLITDIVVLVDRSEGKGVEWAENNNLTLHSLLELTTSDILTFTEK